MWHQLKIPIQLFKVAEARKLGSAGEMATPLTE